MATDTLDVNQITNDLGKYRANKFQRATVRLMKLIHTVNHLDTFEELIESATDGELSETLIDRLKEAERQKKWEIDCKAELQATKKQAREVFAELVEMPDDEQLSDDYTALKLQEYRLEKKHKEAQKEAEMAWGDYRSALLDEKETLPLLAYPEDQQAADADQDPLVKLYNDTYHVEKTEDDDDDRPNDINDDFAHNIDPTEYVNQWVEITSLGKKHRGILKLADSELMVIAELDATFLKRIPIDTIEGWIPIDPVSFDRGRSKFYLLGEWVTLEIEEKKRTRYVNGTLLEIPEYNQPGYYAVGGSTQWRGKSDVVRSVTLTVEPKKDDQTTSYKLLTDLRHAFPLHDDVALKILSGNIDKHYSQLDVQSVIEAVHIIWENAELKLLALPRIEFATNLKQNLCTRDEKNAATAQEVMAAIEMCNQVIAQERAGGKNE